MILAKAEFMAADWIRYAIAETARGGVISDVAVQPEDHHVVTSTNWPDSTHPPNGRIGAAAMRAESMRETLRSVNYFCEMSESSFAQLIAESMIVDFPADAWIIHSNEVPNFLLYIITGKVELYADNSQSLTTVSIIGPGKLMYLASTLLQEPALSNAKTVTEAKILMMPSGVVNAIANVDIGFCKKLLMSSMQSNRSLIRSLNNQKLRNAVERFGSWILHECASTRSCNFKIPYKKRTLASVLGITQENLSRVLSQIAMHGVDIEGSEITITDIEKLNMLVQPHITTEKSDVIELAIH